MLTGAGRGLSLTERTARKLPTPARRCSSSTSPIPTHVDAVRDELAGEWDRVDGVLHAIGFAPAVVPRRRLPRRAVGRRGRRAAGLGVLAQGAGRRVAAADDRGGSIVGLDFDATVALAGLRLDGRRQGRARVDVALPRPRARAEGHPRQPRRRRPDAHDRGQVDPRLRGVRGRVGRRAPLGWDINDSTRWRKACVALLSDWFPTTTGEMRPRRRRLPRHRRVTP